MSEGKPTEITEKHEDLIFEHMTAETAHRTASLTRFNS